MKRDVYCIRFKKKGNDNVLSVGHYAESKEAAKKWFEKERPKYQLIEVLTEYEVVQESCGEPANSKIDIINIDYHRNGVSGMPFNAVLFNFTEDGVTSRMLAIAFEGGEHWAILEVAPLSEDNGVSNKVNAWRSDLLDTELQKCIDEHWKDYDEKMGY